MIIPKSIKTISKFMKLDVDSMIFLIQVEGVQLWGPKEVPVAGEEHSGADLEKAFNNP